MAVEFISQMFNVPFVLSNTERVKPVLAIRPGFQLTHRQATGSGPVLNPDSKPEAVLA